MTKEESQLLKENNILLKENNAMLKEIIWYLAVKNQDGTLREFMINVLANKVANQW